MKGPTGNVKLERWGGLDYLVSCCCVVFGGFTVMKDESLWAQLTAGRENTLSFTPQMEPTIQTKTVLSKRVLVLESVVFYVSCIKQTHPSVCGLMHQNTQNKSTSTANDRCLDKAT